MFVPDPAGRRHRRVEDQSGSSSLEVLALGVLVLALVVGAFTFVALQSLDRTARAPQASSADRFEPDGDAVDTLGIVCGQDEVFVNADVVNARRAGVRVSIDGTPGRRISFWSTGGAEYAFELRAASTSAAVPLPPGTWSVTCPPTGEVAPDPALGTPFQVADPSSVYVRTGPDCDPGLQRDEGGVLATWTGDDPEAALHEALGAWGVLPTDAIERAGYPAARVREDPPVSWVYRVTRGSDERIIAVIDVASGSDGWSYHMRMCADAP